MRDSSSARGTFLVLLALDSGPKHGYEIARWIEDKTNGFFSLSFGALYPILHRLEKQRAIEGGWEDVGAAKRKRVYSLTAAGRKQLREERAHHEAMIGAYARLLRSKA
jgi:DNA-binding PadR family transcriptional regulator